MLALRAEGYTIDEIVEISNLPKASVNARLYRARLSLAKRLREAPDSTRAAPDSRQAETPSTTVRPARLETVK